MADVVPHGAAGAVTPADHGSRAELADQLATAATGRYRHRSTTDVPRRNGHGHHLHLGSLRQHRCGDGMPLSATAQREGGALDVATEVQATAAREQDRSHPQSRPGRMRPLEVAFGQGHQGVKLAALEHAGYTLQSPDWRRCIIAPASLAA